MLLTFILTAVFATAVLSGVLGMAGGMVLTTSASARSADG